MATEAVKVNGGKLSVERIDSKQSFEVSLSDVDSVSFERGGEGEGQSDGTLVLFTKDGERYTVRVADNEAGKYLKAVYDGANDSKAKQKPASKTDENEVVNKV
jgi:hypothetical protein